MRSGMKMLLISGKDNVMRDNRGERYDRREYGTSRYEPMEYRWEDDAESRRRYRRDSRGRFRSEMDEDDWDKNSEMEYRGNYGDSAYPNRPFPVYREDPGMRRDNGRMNQIGFVTNGGNEINTDYRMNATHHTGNEFEGKKSATMGGGYSSNMSMPMTEEMAMEWTAGMKNEDGTKGPHWTMEQVKQAMKQKGVMCDPLEMYAIMNALYSDYCAVMKKHGVNTVDIYIDLACAWLNDKDAVKNKAAAYYEHIVKK